MRRPAAFLLDEPLSNLDAKLRTQMRAELAGLQHRLGTTMIHVTHDQTEAMTLGRRIAVLRDGAIQQVGTPRQLYRHPNNLFVAGFLGSPPMNLLPGRIDGGRLILPMTALPLPPDLAGKARNHDREVIAGIRPEHILPAPAAASGDVCPGRFRLRVDLVEWLGATILVHLVSETGGDGPSGLVAMLGADRVVSEGHVLDLCLAPDALHLFGRDTGARLT